MKRNQSLLMTLSCLGLCLGNLSGNAQTNLIVNGGFETPTVSLSGWLSYQEPSGFKGWSVESGGVDLVGTNFFASASGLQSLDLNAGDAGKVYQDVITVPGEKYRLRFAFAANPDMIVCGGPAVRSMEVRWNSILLATPAQDVRGHSPTDLGWREFSFIVTGGGTDRLSFKSLTPGCAGPAVDDVSLTVATNAINVVNGLAIENAVQVCWPTVPGNSYQVQWALSADTDVWNYLGQPVRGDGLTHCICDPLGGNPRRFYRVLEGN